MNAIMGEEIEETEILLLTRKEDSQPDGRWCEKG